MSPSKPSRTARERRGAMAFTGVLIAVVLVLSAVAALRPGAVPLWAFLGLTGAGIAVALAIYAVRNGWVRVLLLVGVVGVASALNASSMLGASIPFVAGAFVGALLSRDEWPWRRSPEERLRANQPRPLASIRPWSGSGLSATLADVPVGRRGTTETGVRLEAGDVAQRFRVDELHALATGRGGMAESVDADRPEVPGGTVYLVRVDTASPDSIVGEVLVGLPGDALALVPVRDPMPGPAAVLTGADAASFRAWALTIPAP
ncbi:hypothetical protein [Clavibacter sp. MX14-G9D]|uniref:hypothetical protein n=1 Tax=Clavibacter sp. MX14-G9D TaxID=3064656 RepID=UPI00293EF172|nr:hypothetical protein [Clavibacter sp. MX14-G9D]